MTVITAHTILPNHAKMMFKKKKERQKKTMTEKGHQRNHHSIWREKTKKDKWRGHPIQTSTDEWGHHGKEVKTWTYHGVSQGQVSATLLLGCHHQTAHVCTCPWELHRLHLDVPQSLKDDVPHLQNCRTHAHLVSNLQQLMSINLLKEKLSY